MSSSKNGGSTQQPDDVWRNKSQIAIWIGCSDRWVAARLGRYQMPHLCAKGGKSPTYSPAVQAELLAEWQKGERTVGPPENPAPAGWLTALAIAREIEADRRWVSAKLIRYKGASQIYRIPNGQTRRHYPPSVVAQLKTRWERILTRRSDLQYYWRDENYQEVLLKMLAKSSRLQK